MKNNPIWTILTGVIMIGILCVVGAIILVFTNVSTPLNPFQAQAQPTITQLVVNIPSVTETYRVITLPPTWTVTPDSQLVFQASSTLAPTSTLLPTNTPYIASTKTPLPSNTPVPGPTSANARCFVVTETPIDNAEFRPGQEFEKIWTLKNNSSDIWYHSSFDVRFQSGTKLQKDKDVYDLPKQDTAKGETVQIAVHMIAPASPDTYISHWAITDGVHNMCSFYAQIVVK